jgi:hypothetical protein
MKKLNYLIILGVTTAAGTAVGILSKQKKPGHGGLFGAAVGALAGSVAAGIYDRISTQNDKVTYYSTSSPMYESSQDVGYT